MDNKLFEIVFTNDMAVFDLDGTILDKKGLLDNNFENLLKIINLKKIIATGRIKESLIEITDYNKLKELFDEKVICYNGNGIFNTQNNVLYPLNTINNNVWEEIKFVQNKDSLLVIDCGGNLYASNRKAAILCSLYYGISSKKIKIVDFKNFIPYNIMFILIGTKEETQISLIKKNNEVNCSKKGEDIYIFIPNNTNKINGLYYLVQYYNILLKKTIAFGNDNNDIEILSKCNIGIAMKDSFKEVLKVADFIAYSDSLEGIKIYDR